MKCPHCNAENKTKVVDKRNNGMEGSIRRRRECLRCGTRFTTYELRDDLIEFQDEYETYGEYYDD